MAFYRERGLKEFANEVTTDGVGIGGGFIVGGMIGRQVEDLLYNPDTNPVDIHSPMLKKLAAWGANNGAKAALYLLAKHYDTGHPIAKKAAETLAGSVVYDTVLRLANHGYNPAQVTLSGYRILGAGASANPATVQKLVQENSILRTELNKALQKLANSPTPVISTPPSPTVNQTAYNPDQAGDVKYAPVMDPYERQKKYGAMAVESTPTSPAVSERQRKYGAMEIEATPFWSPDAHTGRQRKYGFALGPVTGPTGAANDYGML